MKIKTNLINQYIYNIGMLLHQLPYNLKTIFRKYENKCKNKINKIWSLKFNQTCFNENLWCTYFTITVS